MYNKGINSDQKTHENVPHGNLFLVDRTPDRLFGICDSLIVPWQDKLRRAVPNFPRNGVQARQKLFVCQRGGPRLSGRVAWKSDAPVHRRCNSDGWVTTPFSPPHPFSLSLRWWAPLSHRAFPFRLPSPHTHPHTHTFVSFALSLVSIRDCVPAAHGYAPPSLSPLSFYASTSVPFLLPHLFIPSCSCSGAENARMLGRARKCAKNPFVAIGRMGRIVCSLVNRL